MRPTRFTPFSSLCPVRAILQRFSRRCNRRRQLRPTPDATPAWHNARVAAGQGAGRKPGVVAVARAAGVSPSTVSNAFNRPERLTPALRERVLRVAAELGYGGPDPAARILRRGRAGAIGVILGRLLADAFDDAATAQFLKGVSDATDAHQL